MCIKKQTFHEQVEDLCVVVPCLQEHFHFVQLPSLKLYFHQILSELHTDYNLVTHSQYLNYLQTYVIVKISPLLPFHSNKKFDANVLENTDIDFIKMAAVWNTQGGETLT